VKITRDYFLFEEELMYHHEMISTAEMPIKLIVHQEHMTDTTVLRHWHQALEINYVVNGQAKYTISGQKLCIESGEFVIINSNEVHSGQGIITADNNLALTFQFPYDFMKQEIPNFDEYWFMLPTDKFSAVVDGQFKHELYQYYLDSVTKPNLLLLKSDLYRILYDLVRYFGVAKNKINNLPNLPTLKKLSEVVSYIGEHSAEKLTLPILAEQSHLSIGYLSRSFSRQMDVSVMEYVNLVRVKRAFEMLTNTDKTIETISDLTGFANPKSFRKIFERTYQKTPGRYRYDLRGHKRT